MINEFAEHISSKLQAGFQVERSNAQAGLQFGLKKGSAGKSNTGIKQEGRYNFYWGKEEQPPQGIHSIPTNPTNKRKV